MPIDRAEVTSIDSDFGLHVCANRRLDGVSTGMATCRFLRQTMYDWSYEPALHGINDVVLNPNFSSMWNPVG